MVGRVGEWLGLIVVGTDRDGDRSGMRIGAVFPQTEIGDDPEVIRPGVPAWRRVTTGWSGPSSRRPVDGEVRGDE
jgi:hypothetical protein